MKLKTSFFNTHIVKKDITRFSPIWALYFIGIAMVMFRSFTYSYSDSNYNQMPYWITAFGVVNLIYAGINANMLFGDLYNTRMCYSLHAMPHRRECWLVSHLTSGLLFSLVPNGIIALLMMWQLTAYPFLALYWLLAVTMQYIFFFGVAVMSAMLVGNRFAMLLVYGGLNFVSMLLYGTVEVIYMPMLTGVSTSIETFSLFSPVVNLFRYDFFEFTRIGMNVNENSSFYYAGNYVYNYVGLGNGWGYTAILAGLGVVCMGVSALLYRARNLECAGDFVAFRKLNTPTCVIISLCAALVMAIAGEAFGNSYMLWMIVGLFVGYFGGRMLIERRVKVFQGKQFVGFGLVFLAIIVSIVLMKVDAFGIESYVPKADKVESVSVSGSVRLTLTEEEDIEKITRAHKHIVEHLNYDRNGYYVSICYTMKSGKTVTRNYMTPDFGDSYEIIGKFVNTKENILGFTDCRDVVDIIMSMGYDDRNNEYWSIDADNYDVILEALSADYENGFIYKGGEGPYLQYDVRRIDEDGSVTWDYYEVNISQAKKTLAVLDSLFGDLEKLLDEPTYIAINGWELDVGQCKELLELMRQEYAAGVLTDTSEYEYTEWEITLGTETGSRTFNISAGATQTIAWLKKAADAGIW